MTWKVELTRRDTGAFVDSKLFDHTEAAKRWVKSYQIGVRADALPELAARIYDPDGQLFQETAIRRGGGWRLRWRWAPLVLLLALAAPLAGCRQQPPAEPPSCTHLELFDTALPDRVLATVTLCDGRGDAVATKRPVSFRRVAPRGGAE